MSQELSELSSSSSWLPLTLAPTSLPMPRGRQACGTQLVPHQPWHRVGCASATFCIPGQEGKGSYLQVPCLGEPW